MNIFQRWRRKRYIKNAISNYNSALEHLAEAANGIREAARKCGTSTESLEATANEIQKLWRESAINPDDFKGGNTDGKTR